MSHRTKALRRILTALTLTAASATLALPAQAAPSDPTPGWLSGMAGDNAQAFAAYRGSPVEIRHVWTDTPDVWALAPVGPLYGYKGPLSISMTVPKWTNWHDVAKGKQDATWRKTSQQLAKYRKGAAVTYVSPFWEMNGDWADWSVERTDAGKKDFRDGFARLSKIMRKEMPGVRIVFDPHCHRSLPAHMIPPRSSYDVEGCTAYNSYGWDAKGSRPMADLERLHQRGVKTGHPIAVTEWGNCADPQAPCQGGDAPGYIAAMHKWATKRAGTGRGELVFETYFNLWDAYALIDDQGRANWRMPATVREYAKEF